ncbi:MAG: DUF192 domain-containing protein [Patescibacteria group bacterium]
MKKGFLFIFIFIVFVTLVVFIYQTNFQTEKKFEMPVANDPYKHAEVTINGKVFDAYVSDTEKLREKGLSGLSSIENNEVMLFVLPNSDMYGFWMKDMFFAIDILWLDDNFEVVSFKKNVSPDTFPKIFFPKKPAKYVIELKSGTLTKLVLKDHDKISITGGK